MKAIVLKKFGGVEELELQELPDPVIESDEILVRTSYFGINPVDAKTRKGKGQAARLQKETPMILGWDIAGTVIQTGKATTGFSPGDIVFGMINLPGIGRGYAELVRVNPAHVVPVPENISQQAAAGSGLAAMTAWQALVRHAHVKAGDTVLIHAAAGGVGHFAVQIAKQMGAYVIGTASAANRDFVLQNGADEHIDYRARPFEEVCQPVDIILDSMGGDNIPRSLTVLKTGGTIVSLPSGISETVPEQAAAQGKKGFHFMVQSNADDMRQLADMLGSGELKTHISQIFSMDQIGEAHRLIESGKTHGKDRRESINSTFAK